jgi:hypothetical protein
LLNFLRYAISPYCHYAYSSDIFFTGLPFALIDMSGDEFLSKM